MNSGQWLNKAAAHLEALAVPEARASAEFLLAAALGLNRNEAKLQSQRPLTVREEKQFWHSVTQRAKRLPLAYILGNQPFLGCDIEVNRDVLIPRPETEELVMEAARLLKDGPAEPHILEIGTGTGCIAIALAKLLPQATIYATELSPAALKLAQNNAEALHVSQRIRFIRENLFKPGSAPRAWADLLISNPPYIPTAELKHLEPEVRQEPQLALDGGKDGLDAIRSIIASAPETLKPGGYLALEIGADQGRQVRKLLETRGFQEIRILKDLQGHDRIAVGRQA